MSVEDDIRGASSPGEALLILARAIDALGTAPAASDPWHIPTDEPTPEAIAEEAAWDESAARAEYNRQLKLLGDPPNDAEDLASWTARRSLLADLLKAPTPNVGVADSHVVTVPLGRDKFEVRVPEASAQVRTIRHQFAGAIGLDQPNWWTDADNAIETKDAINAYVKGGPLWLHAYDRKFVMQLPVSARQHMVQDVESFSPDDAHNLARDILKDETADGAKQVVIEHQAAEQGLPRDVDV